VLWNFVLWTKKKITGGVMNKFYSSDITGYSNGIDSRDFGFGLKPPEASRFLHFREKIEQKADVGTKKVYDIF
jgi:hypothetical protein